MWYREKGHLKFILLWNIVLLLFFLFETKIIASVGTDTAVFLLEEIDARSLGMGGAYRTVSDDAGGFYSNPAGLDYFVFPELITMRRNGILGSHYSFVGYIYPSLEEGFSHTFGLSSFVFDAGDIEINYLDGTKENVKAEEDTVYAISYGIKLGEWFFMGSNLKYIQSTLGEKYSAKTFACDGGVLARTIDNRFSLGVSVSNLGLPLKYRNVEESLPLNFNLGTSYKVSNPLLIAFDLMNIKSEQGKIKAKFGAEYLFRKTLALRCGYKTGYQPNCFSVGLGVKVLYGHLDYSYLPGEIDCTHQITFRLKFGSLRPFDIAQKYEKKGMPRRAVYYYAQASKEEERKKHTPVIEKITEEQPREAPKIIVLKGQVIAIDGEDIHIDISRKQGISVGDILRIERKGKKIAIIKSISFLGEEGVITRKLDGEDIRIGDKAILGESEESRQSSEKVIPQEEGNAPEEIYRSGEGKVKVTVNSTPSGATIYIDKKSAGKTPQVFWFKKGDGYTFWLDYPGYERYRKTEQIEKEKDFFFKLQR